MDTLGRALRQIERTSLYLASPDKIHGTVGINGTPVFEYVAHTTGTEDETHVILTPSRRGEETERRRKYTQY